MFSTGPHQSTSATAARSDPFVIYQLWACDSISSAPSVSPSLKWGRNRMHVLDVPEKVIKYANIHEALRRDLGAKYALHSLDLSVSQTRRPRSWLTQTLRLPLAPDSEGKP